MTLMRLYAQLVRWLSFTSARRGLHCQPTNCFEGCVPAGSYDTSLVPLVQPGCFGCSPSVLWPKIEQRASKTSRRKLRELRLRCPKLSRAAVTAERKGRSKACSQNLSPLQAYLAFINQCNVHAQNLPSKVWLKFQV